MLETHVFVSWMGRLVPTYLLGISLFVITSYPTQDAPTLAQLEQLGSL